MKPITLIPLILLTGCLGMPEEATATLADATAAGLSLLNPLGMTEETTLTVVDATAAGLSLLGPWGVAGGALLSTVVAGVKGYSTHKNSKKLISDLSVDGYHRFKKLSDKDKQVLDNDVRQMVPQNYRKYYDKAKELA